MAFMNSVLYNDFFSFALFYFSCISYRSPGGDLGAKKKKKKQKRKKEKPNSGGTKSDSASDSQEIKIQQSSKVRACFLDTAVVSQYRRNGFGCPLG